MAGLPVCDACANYFRNRPFPGWIKVAFTALILLAVLAFIYNQRFFFAHVGMMRGLHELKNGNLERAVTLLNASSERVPEEAALLVNQERSGEAIPLLKEAVAIRPDDPAYALALLEAEAGFAYEQKDYDRFLEVAQTLARRQPDNPIAALGVASAHACKYAVTGDEAPKTLAERQIEAASKMKGADQPAFAEYLDRIRYRLETREIISRGEYLRRFPNGRRPKGAGGGG
jgi:tetratricopeptide (TPR) repeat protein